MTNTKMIVALLCAMISSTFSVKGTDSVQWVAAISVGRKALSKESYGIYVDFTSAGNPSAKDSVQYKVTVK